MNAEAINCPACGAGLEIITGCEFVKCEYCGSTVHIKRRSVNSDGSVSITDKATGMTIGTVQVPFGYQAQGMLVSGASSYTYPFGVSASAYNEKGIAVSYFIGEAYCDRSKCPMLSGMYSQGLEQISRTHYKDFMDVRQYMDGYAVTYATDARATSLKFAEERPMPLYEPFDEAGALENYKRKVEFEKQRNGNAGMVKDTGYYLKGLCRVYDMTVNGQDYKFALTTVLTAWKYQLAGIGGGLDDIGNALGGLFGSVSGGSLGKTLFGNSIIGRAIQKNVQPQQPQQQCATQHQEGAFNDMPMNSVIEWGSDGLFTLQCFPQEFELAFHGAYADFCSTFRLDNRIRERMYDMQSQILQDVARHTQQRIDQMNRQFQSWQQVHATQQAAFDSYNRAWWSRTNSTDAARRSAYQSKIAAENRMSGRYSEAVRGVNTYIRPDGTEVEVSVACQRAYTNSAGDTLGSKSAFEPGGSWTEMNKKW